MDPFPADFKDRIAAAFAINDPRGYLRSFLETGKVVNGPASSGDPDGAGRFNSHPGIPMDAAMVRAGS